MFQICPLYYFIPHNNCQLNAYDCSRACSKIINLWGNCDRHFEQSVPRCAAWLKFNFVSRSFQRLPAILGCNGKWRPLKLSSSRFFKSSSYCCHSCCVICPLRFIWSEVKVLSAVQPSQLRGADLVSDPGCAVLMPKCLLASVGCQTHQCLFYFLIFFFLAVKRKEEWNRRTLKLWWCCGNTGEQWWR